MDDVLSGFDSPENTSLPDQLADWNDELSALRAELDQALSARDSSSSRTRTTKRDLSAAHRRFLHAYNTVAKRAVYIVLSHHGREHEYRDYFLDTRLDESRAPRARR